MSEKNQYNINQVPHRCQAPYLSDQWNNQHEAHQHYMATAIKEPTRSVSPESELAKMGYGGTYKVPQPNPAYDSYTKYDCPEHSTWESEGGSADPDTVQHIIDRAKRTAEQIAKIENQTTDTSDLKEPETCSECGDPVNLVELIRQQIQERRQYLFDELDTLDRDEKGLDYEHITDVLERYEDYI